MDGEGREREEEGRRRGMVEDGGGGRTGAGEGDVWRGGRRGDVEGDVRRVVEGDGGRWRVVEEGGGGRRPATARLTLGSDGDVEFAFGGVEMAMEMWERRVCIYGMNSLTYEYILTITFDSRRSNDDHDLQISRNTTHGFKRASYDEIYIHITTIQRASCRYDIDIKAISINCGCGDGFDRVHRLFLSFHTALS